MDQQPSVGRIVHYVGWDGICRAAIITGVWGGEFADLHVFKRPQDIVFLEDLQSVMRANDNSAIANTWHWPERT